MTEEEKQQYLKYELELLIVEEKSGRYVVTDADTKLGISYDTFEAMPLPVKKALGVIKMLDEGQGVISVGKKISPGVYWVYIWR